MNMAPIAKNHFARIVDIPLLALWAMRLIGADGPSLGKVGPARQCPRTRFAPGVNPLNPKGARSME
jgi:hypothetical protein